MNKEYNIRYIKEEDIEIINSWWVKRGLGVTERSLLPQNGLGGLVIENKDTMIAACYIYLTNSKMGYLSDMVSNPNFKNKAFWYYHLIEACFETAVKSGCERVWTLSKVRSIINSIKKQSEKKFNNLYFKNIDVDISKEKHHVVYLDNKNN